MLYRTRKQRYAEAEKRYFRMPWGWAAVAERVLELKEEGWKPSRDDPPTEGWETLFIRIPKR